MCTRTCVCSSELATGPKRESVCHFKRLIIRFYVLRFKSPRDRAVISRQFVIHLKRRTIDCKVMHKQWEAEEKEACRLIELVVHGRDEDVVQHLKQLPARSRRAAITHMDKEGNSALHLAALRERLGSLVAMLDANVDVATRNGSGESALHVCLSHNALKSARLLIEHGADVNEVVGRKDNETLLHRFVKGDRRAAVDLLLDAGVSLDSRTHDGDTPLHFAARYNKPIMARFLVQCGASVNATNESRETPLHTAVLNLSIDVAKILMRAKASVSVPDKQGMTPLHMAVSAGLADLAKAMLASNSTHVNSKEKLMGRTPLLLACSGTHQKMAPLLLSHGADANLTTNYRKTVLHLAASVGNTHALNAVIKHASNLNALTTNNKTPLHCAVGARQAEAVTTLLRAGVNPNLKDIEGDTALHLAAADGDSRIASQLLLQPGILVNATNMRQRTPLHSALMAGHEQIGSLLLEAGCDSNVRDVFEKNPHDYLLEYHQKLAAEQCNGEETYNAHEASKVHFSIDAGGGDLSTLARGSDAHEDDNEANGRQYDNTFLTTAGECSDQSDLPNGASLLGQQAEHSDHGHLTLANGGDAIDDHSVTATNAIDIADLVSINEESVQRQYENHEEGTDKEYGSDHEEDGEGEEHGNLESQDLLDSSPTSHHITNVSGKIHSHTKHGGKHRGRHRKTSNHSTGSGKGASTSAPHKNIKQSEGKKRYQANMLGMVIGGHARSQNEQATAKTAHEKKQQDGSPQSSPHSHVKHEDSPPGGGRRRKLGLANIN